MALKTNGASVPNQGAEMEKILSPKGTSDVDRCGSVFDRIFGTKASKMSGKYRKFLHRRRGVDAEWSVQIPHDAGRAGQPQSQVEQLRDRVEQVQRPRDAP
jgi:hypothetical protein